MLPIAPPPTLPDILPKSDAREARDRDEPIDTLLSSENTRSLFTTGGKGDVMTFSVSGSSMFDSLLTSRGESNNDLQGGRDGEELVDAPRRVLWSPLGDCKENEDILPGLLIQGEDASFLILLIYSPTLSCTESSVVGNLGERRDSSPVISQLSSFSS
jgi:hypothetical protein